MPRAAECPHCKVKGYMNSDFSGRNWTVVIHIYMSVLYMGEEYNRDVLLHLVNHKIPDSKSLLNMCFKTTTTKWYWTL